MNIRQLQDIPPQGHNSSISGTGRLSLSWLPEMMPLLDLFGYKDSEVKHISL